MSILQQSHYRVFGNAGFAGNPVTLYQLDDLQDSQLLQRTASQASSQDSVFFSGTDAGPVAARCFSSQAELYLCGHGLLALAHHLLNGKRGLSRALETPYGALELQGRSAGAAVVIPAFEGLELVDRNHSMARELVRIGMTPTHLHLFPNGVWVVQLPDLDALHAIDTSAIAELQVADTTPGALIAAVALENGYGFRYFSPWHGKTEDSGTGSAQCYLAPLLLQTRDECSVQQFSPQGTASIQVQLGDTGVRISGCVRAVPA